MRRLLGSFGYYWIQNSITYNNALSVVNVITVRVAEILSLMSVVSPQLLVLKSNLSPRRPAAYFGFVLYNGGSALHIALGWPRHPATSHQPTICRHWWSTHMVLPNRNQIFVTNSSQSPPFNLIIWCSQGLLSWSNSVAYTDDTTVYSTICYSVCWGR